MKRLIIYLMILHTALFPAFRAYAIAPALVIGAEIASSQIFRFAATEVGITVLAKAVEASNAYYSASAKVSNSNFVKYFKGKAWAGVAAFASVAVALDWAFNSDGELVANSPADSVTGEFVEGYVYGTCGSSCPYSYYPTVTALADAYLEYGIVSTVTDKYHEITYDASVPRWAVAYRGTVNGTDKLLTSKYYYQYECATTSSATNSEACVSPDSFESSGDIVDDTIAYSALADYLGAMNDSELLKYFADEQGVFDGDLSEYVALESESVPLMLDNETVIPPIGSPYWDYADWMVNGVAQSSDSESDNYVPVDLWDDSYYLANTVANGNPAITSLNTGSTTITDGITDNSGSNTDSGTGDISVSVDVSGIEQRLDVGNSLSESILSEVKYLNNTTVEVSSVPDVNVAASFWSPRYPNGIGGVIDDFMSDMKQTDLFLWLGEFKLSLGSGTEPIFDICFDEVANIDFGCFSLMADSYVWSAIKASMILFSLIAARRIVFGG